jgi:hypothetical protein
MPIKYVPKGQYKFSDAIHAEVWAEYKKIPLENRLTNREYKSVLKLFFKYLFLHVFAHPAGVSLPKGLGRLKLFWYLSYKDVSWVKDEAHTRLKKHILKTENRMFCLKWRPSFIKYPIMPMYVCKNTTQFTILMAEKVRSNDIPIASKLERQRKVKKGSINDLNNLEELYKKMQKMKE